MSNKLRSLQNLLALSALTLIVTVWSTVSFLAYQNSLLNKNIVNNQIQKQYLPTQVSKNTDGWNTFIDANYAFKYPSTWNVEEFDGGNKVIYNADENVSFGLIQNPPETDYSCWTLKYSDSQTIIDGSQSQKSYYIATYNQSGHDCLNPLYKTQRLVKLSWSKNGNKYSINYYYDNNKEEIYLHYLDQILSTFQFQD